jgi:hypothetical protein
MGLPQTRPNRQALTDEPVEMSSPLRTRGFPKLWSLALFACLSFSRPAHADWNLGVDGAAILPLGEVETNLGWIAGAHAGYVWQLPALELGPEIGANYGALNPEADARKSVGGGYVGVRAALPEVPLLVPYGYLHFGYGVADTRHLPDPNQRERFASGLLFDATLGLRRSVLPFLDIGLEAGFAMVEPGKCFCARWAHLGGAVNVRF